MLKFVMTASVLLGIALPTLPAQAQANCNTRESFVKILSEKYGEVSHGVGVQSPTQVIELYSSGVTGSWTILASRADGTACVMATGKNWIQNPAFLTAFDEKVSLIVPVEE
jgi:hypothetical protein